MNFNPTKLEIEVSSYDKQEFIDVGTFAFKNICPAIVVPAEAVQAAIVDRSMRNGQYLVIAAVDFMNRNYALDKWRPYTDDIFGADGFEITIGGRNEVQCANEIRTIMDYVKGYNSIAEIRFVLNSSMSEATIKACAKEFIQRKPSFVRTDVNLVVERKAEDLSHVISTMSPIVAVPFKACGISAQDPAGQHKKAVELLSIRGVQRIGVTLKQARAIQKAATMEIEVKTDKKDQVASMPPVDAERK